LPSSHNIEVGFREVFPQKYGGRRWTEQFNATMRNAELDLGMFMFFAGGADDWSSDYPLTGVPAMNALFRGATTIYNDTGDFYREPMELVSAEYSWNTRSNGFYLDPMKEDETRDIWRRYIFQENQPAALFGPGKLFEQACTLLYGPQAAMPMAAYYRESASLPDREVTGSNAGSDSGYLPMGWNRVHAVLDHWRDLALDSKQRTLCGSVREDEYRSQGTAPSAGTAMECGPRAEPKGCGRRAECAGRESLAGLHRGLALSGNRLSCLRASDGSAGKLSCGPGILFR
jgi:hypothetical protein